MCVFANIFHFFLLCPCFFFLYDARHEKTIFAKIVYFCNFAADNPREIFYGKKDRYNSKARQHRRHA